MSGTLQTWERGVVRHAVRAADSYGLVLALLAVTYVTLAFASPGFGQRLALVVLQGATTLFALRTSRVPKRMLAVAIVLFLFAVSGLVIAAVATPVIRAGLPEAVSGMLLLVAPAAILWRVLQHRRVTGQTIMGAIAVYVLVGLLMAFVFAAIEGLTVEPFFTSGQRAEYPDFLFFSFVTLTTTGYGNLVPASTLGQTLAVFEAMAGQVYLVTLVARLVGLFGREASEQ